MCRCIGMSCICGTKSSRDARRGREGPLAGIGVDTWGVDFGLLNRHGRLIGNPYHYRDGRTDGMLAEAFRRTPRAEIFEQTGIQFLQINSLYQLLSMTLSGAPELAEAETFLPMPSLFSYWLSGRAVCEFSIATTTQCYDPRLDGWATPLLEALGIPTGIFPEVVPAGTVLGPLQSRPGGGVGRRSRPDHRARLPRHRLRRRRGARPPARAPQRLRLDQLGHLVGDGRRAGRAAHHAAKPGV